MVDRGRLSSSKRVGSLAACVPGPAPTPQPCPPPCLPAPTLAPPAAGHTGGCGGGGQRRGRRRGRCQPGGRRPAGGGAGEGLLRAGPRLQPAGKRAGEEWAVHGGEGRAGAAPRGPPRRRRPACARRSADCFACWVRAAAGGRGLWLDAGCRRHPQRAVPSTDRCVASPDKKKHNSTNHALPQEGEAFDSMYEAGGILSTEDGTVSVLAGATLGGEPALLWRCCGPAEPELEPVPLAAAGPAMHAVCPRREVGSAALLCQAARRRARRVWRLAPGSPHAAAPPPARRRHPHQLVRKLPHAAARQVRAAPLAGPGTRPRPSLLPLRRWRPPSTGRLLRACQCPELLPAPCPAAITCRREWAERLGLPAFASREYDEALHAVCSRLGVGAGLSPHR